MSTEVRKVVRRSSICLGLRKESGRWLDLYSVEW